MNLPGFAPYLHLARCDSTQTVLARHLELGRGMPGHWHLALADEQTAGRGRTGARWHGQPGDAVLMTLAVQLPLPAGLWPRTSLVAGLAAAGVLGDAVRLKWPNDLMLDAGGWKKLGGILCERVETLHGPWWLCGIGVNVRAVPDAVAGTAVALADGRDRLTLARDLALGIRAGVERFVAQSGQLPLVELDARLAFGGAHVTLSDGTRGLLHGLSEEGGLRVADRVVHAGSIVAAAGLWQAPPAG